MTLHPLCLQLCLTIAVVNLANDIEAASSAVVALATLGGALHQRWKHWWPFDRRKKTRYYPHRDRRRIPEFKI